MYRNAFWIASLSLFLVTACEPESSGGGGAECGPGTKLVDGQCVVDGGNNGQNNGANNGRNNGANNGQNNGANNGQNNGANNGNNGIECSDGLDLCGDSCVDLETDLRFCGDCQTECDGGQRCVQGRCETAGDCREDAPCEGLSYCDLNTGECVPGCLEDEQCAEREVCDTGDRACVCEPSTHRCSGVCVRDADVDHCGDRCDPCPSAPNAEATCNGGQCGTSCVSGHHKCDGDCVSNNLVATCGDRCDPCPTPRNGSPTCNSGSCGIECNSGYHACRGECLDDTSVDSCGDRCSPCPRVDGGIVSCTQGRCEVECTEGFRPCNDGCCPWQIEDPIPARGNSAFGESNQIVLRGDEVHTVSIRVWRGGTDYALRTNGQWERETIFGSDSENLRVWSDMDVNTSGEPVVCFINSGRFSRAVYCQVQVRNDWEFIEGSQIRLDDGVSVYDVAFDMAIDNDDVINMAWCTEEGGPLVFDTVPYDTAQEVHEGPCEDVAMRMDGDGAPQLAFVAAGMVYFAVGAGESWTVEPVATGGYVDLFIDNQGQPHISLRDGGDIKYAHKENNRWVVQTVETSVVEYGQTQVAVGSDGKPHLTYNTFSDGVTYMKYALWTGEYWFRSVVDVGVIGTGLDSSLELDRQNNPHIVYGRRTEDISTGMRYAH